MLQKAAVWTPNSAKTAGLPGLPVAYQSDDDTMATSAESSTGGHRADSQRLTELNQITVTAAASSTGGHRAESQIVFMHAVIYRGPKDALPDSYFTRTWHSHIDVATFPGANHFDVHAMHRVLAPVLDQVAELGFAEVGPAITFLDYLGATQEFWRRKEESSHAGLPLRLVLSALAAGCLTPCLVQAAAIEWNRFKQGKVVRDLAIPLTGVQALLTQGVAQEADLVRFVLPLAVHSQGHIFCTPPSFSSVDFSWSRWFPKSFPWTSEDAGIALALKGGAAAHMLHGHGFGDLDFYLYRTDGHTNCGDDYILRGGDLHESAAVMLIDRAVRALCSASKRNLLVRNSGTLTIIMEMADQHIQRVQFFMHVFDSISQIMITSDIDVTQVVYCGAAHDPHNLYLSPLAVTAYDYGFITIRQDLDSSRQQRTLRRLACYVRRGFGICAPQSHLQPPSFRYLHSLMRSAQLRHLEWQSICELDKPFVLPVEADSGPEGDLPVKSIALRWAARKSLKAFTDYQNSPCEQEILFEQYAHGKMLCSWCPFMQDDDMQDDDDDEDDPVLPFNINNRGSLRGGIRAYLCSWAEQLPQTVFYPQQMLKFFLLEDKCSMPWGRSGRMHLEQQRR